MNTETQWILAVAGAALVIVGVILYLIKRRQSHPAIDTDQIVDAIGKDNIKSVDFSRNKIVIATNNARNTNLQKLKASGAIGINVVGNTVKFYYERDNAPIVESLKSFEGSDQ